MEKYYGRYSGGISSNSSVTSSGSRRSKSSADGTLAPGSIEVQELYQYDTADGNLYRTTIHIKNVTPFRLNGPKPFVQYDEKVVNIELIDTSNSYNCIICGLEDEGSRLIDETMRSVKNNSLDMDMLYAKFNSILKSVKTLQTTYPKHHKDAYLLVRWISNALNQALKLPTDIILSDITSYYVKNYPTIIPAEERDDVTRGRIRDADKSYVGFIPSSTCNSACIVVGKGKSKGGYSKYSRGGYNIYYGNYNRNYYPNSMHGGELGNFRNEIGRPLEENLRDIILNIELN